VADPRIVKFGSGQNGGGSLFATIPARVPSQHWLLWQPTMLLGHRAHVFLAIA
jgi:hypothetical protein